MAANELFQAINPAPTKQLVHLERTKYDLVLSVILANLQEHGPLTFDQLVSLVENQLRNNFNGSLMRYCRLVKLNLEVCGEIRCLPGSKPQMIEISQ